MTHLIAEFFRTFIPHRYVRCDQPSPPLNIEGVQENEIEAILDSTTMRRKQHFSVKLKGYGDLENTWQTQLDLKSGKESQQAYQTTRQGLLKRGNFKIAFHLLFFFSKISLNFSTLSCNFNEIGISEDTKMSHFCTFSEISRFYISFNYSDSVRA